MKAKIQQYPLAFTLGFFFIVSQILLVIIYLRHDTDLELAKVIRDMGMWVVLLAFLYKTLIFLTLLMTANKNKLDRSWNWQQGVTASLFLYTFVAVQVGAGQAITSPIWSIMWYEIWVQMVLSCATVSWYVIRYRIRPVLRACRVDGRFCGWTNLYQLLKGEDSVG